MKWQLGFDEKSYSARKIMHTYGLRVSQRYPHSRSDNSRGCVGLYFRRWPIQRSVTAEFLDDSPMIFKKFMVHIKIAAEICFIQNN